MDGWGGWWGSVKVVIVATRYGDRDGTAVASVCGMIESNAAVRGEWGGSLRWTTAPTNMTASPTRRVSEADGGTDATTRHTNGHHPTPPQFKHRVYAPSRDASRERTRVCDARSEVGIDGSEANDLSSPREREGM